MHLVPNKCHYQHVQRQLQKRNFKFNIKATTYFDFLTNNDTTPEVYFGNISMFNFRNYDGLDESFAKILQDNKDKIGAKVDYIPGNDAIYTAFADDVSRSY